MGRDYKSRLAFDNFYDSATVPGDVILEINYRNMRVLAPALILLSALTAPVAMGSSGGNGNAEPPTPDEVRISGEVANAAEEWDGDRAKEDVWNYPNRDIMHWEGSELIVDRERFDALNDTEKGALLLSAILDFRNTVSDCIVGSETIEVCGEQEVEDAEGNDDITHQRVEIKVTCPDGEIPECTYLSESEIVGGETTSRFATWFCLDPNASPLRHFGIVASPITGAAANVTIAGTNRRAHTDDPISDGEVSVSVGPEEDELFVKIDGEDIAKTLWLDVDQGLDALFDVTGTVFDRNYEKCD